MIINIIRRNMDEELVIWVIIIIDPLLMVEQSVIHHFLQLFRSLSATLRSLRHPAPIFPVFDERLLQSANFSLSILWTFLPRVALDNQLLQIVAWSSDDVSKGTQNSSVTHR